VPWGKGDGKGGGDWGRPTPLRGKGGKGKGNDCGDGGKVLLAPPSTGAGKEPGCGKEKVLVACGCC
jgi:hypothetical protein